MQIDPEVYEDLKRRFGEPVPEEEIAKAVEAVRVRIEKPPTVRRQTQGKCLVCRECFRWSERFPLKRAYCPQCGSKLRPTTRDKRWPWTEGIRPLSCIEAWIRFHR